MDNNRPMTKKEMIAARHEEKMASFKSKRKQANIKWIVIGLASVIFLGFFGFLIFLAKQNNPTVTAEPVEPVEISTATGWSLGADDSKVTLVEFGDLQCPACREYHPVVKELLAGYQEGDVKFVFKHFPLIAIHPNAMAAALAAEAAGTQGKFFEYHDVLYEMQDTWAGLAAINADEKFIEYAEELELDLDQFDVDRADAAAEGNVRANMDEGINSGVSGTPSFFVNSQRINNPADIEEFRGIIDEALK